MVSTLNDDMNYKNQFIAEQEKYFTEYFDLKKLEERNESYKYLMNELIKGETNCPEKTFHHVMSKKKLLKSQNAKKLCRDGIPLKYMKQVLFKMFAVNASKEDYEKHLAFVLKGRDITVLQNYVPYFTNLTFEESGPVHYLNEKGINALKEIMWLINSVCPSVEYSPLIIKGTSFLLLLMTKEETFELMRTLIELSINVEELNSGRWHFRFGYSENLKFIGSNMDAIIEHGDTLTNEQLKKVTESGTSKMKLVSDMSQSMFLSYLNFAAMIHFLPFYLYEGSKAIYRMTYAVISATNFSVTSKMLEEDAILYFKTCSGTKIKNISVLKEMSYKYNLKHSNNTFLSQKIQNIDTGLSRKKMFYIPTISNTEATIITNEQLTQLWPYIPHEGKTNDGKLIFSKASSPEADLSSLYDIFSKLEKNNLTLFVIQTEKGEIFGGMMNQTFEGSEDGHYLQPKYCNLITISPEIMVHFPIKDAQDIVLFEPKVFRFGNGNDGPAISIDFNLKEGWTEKETIFGSVAGGKDQNAEGDFLIKNMEIFVLV